MGFKEYMNASKYAEILHMKRFELAFCVCYFILALIICFYSTPKGSLFSPDSTAYVRDAENFLSFFPNYYAGPIYPALIAIIMGLGLTSVQSAGLVPIVSYSMLGFPLFFIGKIISRPMAGYITCIISLLCGKYLLYISTYAWTDMPFLFFSALAILFISIYKKYGILSSIAFAGLFASLSIYTRTIGIALIPVGIIIIILNEKRLKSLSVALACYCIMPIALTILRIIITIQHGTKWLYDQNSGRSNLSLDSNAILFMKYMNRVTYDDYKEIVSIIFVVILLIIIYMCLSRQIFIFIKNTIHITSYILIYSAAVILATANTPISIDVAGFDFRYVVPIFPFIVLIVVILFITAYDTISDNFYTNIFKLISVILLICLVAQGSNALYSKATDIRAKSIADHINRDRLDQYMQYENPTWNNTYIYRIKNDWDWPKYQMELYSHQTKSEYKFIGNISNSYLNKRIKAAGNIPIYIIIPNKVARTFVQNLSNEICLNDSYRFSDAIIYKINVPENNESCKYGPSSILNNMDKTLLIPLAGDFMDKKHIGKKYDQLLILTSNLSGTKKNECNLRIIDFVNGSISDVPYPGQPETIRSSSYLTGDFTSLGYDQVLRISEGRTIIEDFSQGKTPAITRYSEVPPNDSALRNLLDADAPLAGDFLARGHSQALFVYRKESKLVIADFSQGKEPEAVEFTEIDDNSTLLKAMLDSDDLLFAGDFMNLGHDQALFINRNHTNPTEPKIIISDFSSGENTPSIKYLENWGESSSLGGWIDNDDTQLIGDFMDKGHSQLLLINHNRASGKIMIVDFSQDRSAGQGILYWEDWNSGILFEGWLEINDTMLAGDFKGRSFSQIAFINNSINESIVTIVDFISGKSSIAL